MTRVCTQLTVPKKNISDYCLQTLQSVSQLFDSRNSILHVRSTFLHRFQSTEVTVSCCCLLTLLQYTFVFIVPLFFALDLPHDPIECDMYNEFGKACCAQTHKHTICLTSMNVICITSLAKPAAHKHRCGRE